MTPADVMAFPPGALGDMRDSESGLPVNDVTGRPCRHCQIIQLAGQLDVALAQQDGALLVPAELVRYAIETLHAIKAGVEEDTDLLDARDYAQDDADDGYRAPVVQLFRST